MVFTCLAVLIGIACLVTWGPRYAVTSLKRPLLLGEELEARWVLSTYEWSQPSVILVFPASNNWSDRYAVGPVFLTNWKIQSAAGWIQSSTVPGAGDTVYFSGAESNQDCIVDKADIKVGTLNIDRNYRGNIILQNPLTVIDGGRMDSGTITGFPRVNASSTTVGVAS